MTFSIYDALEGGTPLWTQTHTGVTVSGGVFNVLLGEPEYFNSDMFVDNDRLWLGITVGTDEEMAPRNPFSSVPYAWQTYRATVAETLNYHPGSYYLNWNNFTGVPTGFNDQVDNDTLADLSCAAGQITKWSGTVWECVDYNAATGTAMAGDVLSGKMH